MRAGIKAIEYHLPENILSNADLAQLFPEWPVERIQQKTGISLRHIAAPEECSSDLAVAAARKLFDSGVFTPAEIDFVLLCTQSPDYFLPTTACLVQERLGIPTTAGALDFNLGCSGFIYGLSLARGLVETGQAVNVLLLTAETYSKFIHPKDKSVRTLFGDAAAATLVSAFEDHTKALIGPFLFGTDGRGAGNLIVRTGGLRCPRTAESAVAAVDDSGNVRAADNLYMDGGEIFAFTLRTIPRTVEQLIARSGVAKEAIDLFVFHQANRYMLDHLRKTMKIPSEKFVMHLEDCGNTVSSTIPIALNAAVKSGSLRTGSIAMLVGFGVGYSWGATLLEWRC